MRQHERYRFREGYTPLSAQELNDRFFALDGRLHQLELLKVSWEEAVSLILNHGLTRLNQAIQPLLDQASALVVEVQDDIDAIKTQWQGILDEWAGCEARLDAMQASLDVMQAEIVAAEAAASEYTDVQIAAAVPVAPIQLIAWQTNPDQYTVENQDIDDTDGHGADSFYHYVFHGGNSNMMYCTIGPMPLSGYSLQVNFSYRMTTTDLSNTVNWAVIYKTIATGESAVEITNYATMYSARDGVVGFNDYVSAANTLNVITGTDIVIPASAYSQGDILHLCLIRWSTGGHAGNAEVNDNIFLLPMLP